LPRTGHSIYFLGLTVIEAIIVISLEAAVFGIFFGTKFVYTHRIYLEKKYDEEITFYP
jgi:hypothetical protein